MVLSSRPLLRAFASFVQTIIALGVLADSAMSLTGFPELADGAMTLTQPPELTTPW